MYNTFSDFFLSAKTFQMMYPLSISQLRSELSLSIAWIAHWDVKNKHLDRFFFKDLFEYIGLIFVSIAHKSFVLLLI